jgi:CRP/FNR family transcriptional regulator
MCEILEMENIDKGTTIQLQDTDNKNIFFLKKGTIKIVDTTTNNTKYIVKKVIFLENSPYMMKILQPKKQL